jgi:hypothetical protein
LIEPYQQRITDWLDAEVSVATIAERLPDEHGLDSSESSVRRGLRPIWPKRLFVRG